jgi:hypothetical protein
MKIARRISGSAVIAGSLVLCGFAAAAQQESPDPAKGKEMTMTGCLNKGGDVPQHFSFVDQKTGKKWNVTGQADLAKHSANHTVRITGNQTAKVFNVTKLEHVSGTCEAKGGTDEK